MIVATDMLFDSLRADLPLYNDKFGACVGISCGKATWSVDRSGNPIVVGRGVVHACRANGGGARTIRFTNNVYQYSKSLLEESSVDVKQVQYVTKEYPEGSGVTIHEISQAPGTMCSEHTFLRSLCEEVFNDLVSRNSGI